MAISVVIPFYNGQKYMRESIDSVLSQSLSDFELICVDDHSTDDTWNILNEYANADSRVRIYKTSSNSGSANCTVDVGISKAKYDWVCVSYQDDYLEKDYLKKLLKRQSETAADIVCTKQVFFNEREFGFKSIPSPCFDMGKILSGTEAALMNIEGWGIAMNGCLCKKSIFTAKEHYLDSSFNHMNADEYNGRELLLLANRVSFIDACFYYRDHEESITHNVARSFEALITDWLLLSLFETRFGIKSKERRFVLSWYVNHLPGVWYRFSKLKKSMPTEVRTRCYNLLATARKKITIKDLLFCDASFKNKILNVIPTCLYNLFF